MGSFVIPKSDQTRPDQGDMAPPPAPPPGLLRSRLPKLLRPKRLAVLAFAAVAYLVLSSQTGSQTQWRPLNPHATATRSNDLVVAAVANYTLGVRTSARKTKKKLFRCV